MEYNKALTNWGLFVIRVGLGIIFMIHGWPKLVGGTGQWQWLGGNMALLGVSFAPIFWGFMAAFTEFFGGIALVFGVLTRLASLGLAFVMFVATVMHVTKGDPFTHTSHPLSLLVVFIGLTIAGGGAYSLDSLWWYRRS